MKGAQQVSTGNTRDTHRQTAIPGQPEKTWLDVWQQRLPGLLLATTLALIAQWLGNLAPIVGAPIFAILLGMLLKNTRGVSAVYQPGVAFTGKKILQTAIVLLGAGLTLRQIWNTGAESMAVLLTTLIVGVAGSLLLGRLLGVPYRLRSLIAVGTGICGASAIAAISPIVVAESTEVAYAISTVFLFNVIAVFIFPLIGHVLNFSDVAFGIWAGTAINDTSSVVAAGYAFSSVAGSIATIVKLTRTTMIIPIALLFTVYEGFQQRGQGSGRVNLLRLIPWFIVWFLVASILTSVGLIPTSLAHFSSQAGKFLIVVALAAVGLGANLRQLVRTGYKPLLLGLITWVLIAATSLVVQHLGGQI